MNWHEFGPYYFLRVRLCNVTVWPLLMCEKYYCRMLVMRWGVDRIGKVYGWSSLMFVMYSAGRYKIRSTLMSVLQSAFRWVRV
jgi:hypothetical protein